MNLYLLHQDINGGFDTYDSCVVCAASEAEARWIHPQERDPVDYDREWGLHNWVNPDQVTAQLLGVADAAIPAGVVCASFNAG